MIRTVIGKNESVKEKKSLTWKQTELKFPYLDIGINHSHYLCKITVIKEEAEEKGKKRQKNGREAKGREKKEGNGREEGKGRKEEIYYWQNDWTKNIFCKLNRDNTRLWKNCSKIGIIEQMDIERERKKNRAKRRNNCFTTTKSKNFKKEDNLCFQFLLCLISVAKKLN